MQCQYMCFPFPCSFVQLSSSVRSTPRELCPLILAGQRGTSKNPRRRVRAFCSAYVRLCGGALVCMSQCASAYACTCVSASVCRGACTHVTDRRRNCSRGARPRRTLPSLRTGQWATTAHRMLVVLPTGVNPAGTEIPHATWGKYPAEAPVNKSRPGFLRIRAAPNIRIANRSCPSRARMPPPGGLRNSCLQFRRLYF